MASAAFPSVIAAVVAVAEQALSPVRVVRGRDTSNEQGDVVIVGVQDVEDIQDLARPVATAWASAGAFQQTMQTFGGGREEVGTVSGLIVAQNGDGDIDAACTAAFDHLALLEAAVRADPKLGLTTFDYVVAEFQAGSVSESQNDVGAAAALAFTISYKIRI